MLIYSVHYSHFINENISAESSGHLYYKENGNQCVCDHDTGAEKLITTTRNMGESL